MTTDISWGTDGVISLPQAMESTNTEMADMGGFCFTPNGIRINISVAEREDVILAGYRPQRGQDV